VLSERNPEGPYKLAQLVRANMALYDYTVLFGTPCISGKDSMKNDYMFKDIKISVPQTVLISAISVIDDVRRAVTIDLKDAGDLIIVIGKTYAELAGSEYLAAFGLHGNMPPRVRGRVAKRTYRAIERAMTAGLIKSCHDISDGGFACCLAESAFAGGLGVDVELSKVPSVAIYRDDFLLFSESASRFIVSVEEGCYEKFAALLKGVPFSVIGRVRADGGFNIKGMNGNQIMAAKIEELEAAWLQPFKENFNA